MRVGTMFLGEVEAQDGQSIQTKFFVLGVPLFPVESYWATASSGTGVVGFPIPLHGKSVAFGYLRVYAWLGALLAGVFSFLGRRHETPYELYAVAAVSLVVAVVSTFVLGGIDDMERARRELLFKATRLYAPPHILPPEKADEIAAALEKVWKRTAGRGGWEERIDAGNVPPEEQAMLYALARYRFDDARAHAMERAIF